MLVGFFGLLFVSALQGEGDFYGDLKEPRWSFVDADHDRKVRFDNPVLEMDKKVDLFRRLMSQKKVYNLKIDTAVVVVGTKSEVPMYLSHMGEENIVMTVKDFKRFLAPFKKDLSILLEGERMMTRSPFCTYDGKIRLFIIQYFAYGDKST